MMLLLVVLCTASGCQPTAVSRLLGQWVGSPDSAAARAEREAIRYGEIPPANSPPDGEKPAGDKATDWEQHDLSIKFQFVSPERLEMSLADGSQPIVAQWSVLETTPTGCTIEVFTEESDSERETERRRFRLDFEQHNGILNGFLLTEVGADPQLGAIYFRRDRE